MSAKIFEFAIIHHPAPTKDENDRGVEPKSALLKDVTRILARDVVRAF